MNSNKEILQQANAAITQGDYEGFLSFCTEDTQWTFVGEPTLHGKPAVRQWMAEAYTEPPQFMVEHLIADGDFVTAVGKIDLKDETGISIRHAYCDVWRFEQGKMCQLTAFVLKPATVDQANR